MMDSGVIDVWTSEARWEVDCGEDTETVEVEGQRKGHRITMRDEICIVYGVFVVILCDEEA
jgi:hypothetical protein